MDENQLQLAAIVTNTVANHTTEYVTAKLDEAKNKKTLEEQQAIYSELIYGLISDKNTLSQAAREYQQLYESMTITEKDIVSLQNTIKSIVEQLKPLMKTTDEQEKTTDEQDDLSDKIDVLVNLLNKDTLRTMQLIGFNYKQAIGKPLTEVCYSLIKGMIGPND